MTNISATTQGLAARWARLLDEIAERQEDLKQLKADAKADGFNLRCLAQIVKEQRRGAKYQAEQLALEFELDVYREAVGLPTDHEVAQSLVRDAVADTAKRTKEPVQ